jgi:hypothetical protein
MNWQSPLRLVAYVPIVPSCGLARVLPFDRGDSRRLRRQLSRVELLEPADQPGKQLWIKNEYGLAPLRVRGLERVALHADLVMLARLSQALARVRAMPRAA